MENPFKVLEDKLSGIETMISEMKNGSATKKAKPNDDVDLLTREETCELLKINSSTLWTWTNDGKVKAYAIGARRYYKRSEIMASLIPVEN